MIFAQFEYRSTGGSPIAFDGKAAARGGEADVVYFVVATVQGMGALYLSKKGDNLRKSVKRQLSIVKSTFWAILLGAALIIPSFGQLALNTSAITSTTATLRWNKSTDRDVKGYRLHCGLTSGGHYSRFVDVGNVTTYTLSNLIPGKTYYCVVTTYNASGKESRPSNEISFNVSPSITPAITSSTVALAWDRSPGRGVKGYRLHYGTASHRYSSIIDVGNVTTYKISNLTTGKTYYLVVTSYDKTGRESPPSNEISFTVSPPALNNRK